MVSVPTGELPVSPACARQEEQLAAHLVQRKAQRLFLTDGSDAFYRRGKPLLGAPHEAESAVNEAALKPAGLLRVTAP